MTDPVVKPVDNAKEKENMKESAKKRVAEGKEVRSVQDAQRAALAKGKPTPTQEENDLAVSGGYPDLEEDGSGPDTAQQRAIEAGRGGGYQTRQSSAQPAHAGAPARGSRSE